VLAEAETLLGYHARHIAAARGVQIDYGPVLPVSPAPMDGRLRATLRKGAAKVGIAFQEMASGAGHDALTFAGLGIPTAMLFIRNTGGSHNPAEAMAMEDFTAALEVLLAAIEEIAA